MNQKFSFRAIQQGQTQQSHVVNAGAGQNGQALVVRAAAGMRYQLADLLTLTSPKKLQLKRVGQDLMVALPGNDVTSPDIVIKDYFNFKDLSLSGLAASGEPMVYDTSSSFNIGQSATGITPESLAANKTTAATLATASGGWFDGGMGLAALGGGGLLLAAAAGGGGSDSTTNAGLTKITTYKGDATKSVPTVTDFATAGVTGVDASNITGILTLFSRTQLPLDTAASLQTLVDSFKKIVAEANGTSADATTEDPSATDYVNLMGANTPNSISTKPQALALLNDHVKALNTTDVDSYSEVKALADIVETIATLAQTAASTTGTAATTGNITAAQLTSLGVDVTATSLTAVSDAIRAGADDLSGLNTTAKLSALVKAYNTILAEANGTTEDATVTNPSAADYAAIGADIGTAKTDTAAIDRLNKIVGNLATTAVDTVGEITKLAATLDKIQTVAALATGVTLTDAQKFSADELKNLGLTGFTGTETQNTALALKVSDAIRDKAVADVVAGDFANGKLHATEGTRITWTQTQLERLQTLVSQEIIKNYVADTNNTPAPNASEWAIHWANVGVFHNPATNADATNTKWVALSTTEVTALNSVLTELAPTASTRASTAELQLLADAYARILQEANGTGDSNGDKNTVDPTPADFARLGLTGTVATAGPSFNLLLNMVENLNSSDVDTFSELKALAATAAKFVEAAGNVDVTNFSQEELTKAGLMSVPTAVMTAEGLAYLESQLRAIGNTAEVETAAKAKAQVSLALIRAWANAVDTDPSDTGVSKSGFSFSPSTADYANFTDVQRFDRVTALATENGKPIVPSQHDVNVLNTVFDNLPDASFNTLAKLKTVAESLFRILNEANGSTADANITTAGTAVQQDYINIGLTGMVTTDAGAAKLLNSVVSNQTYTADNAGETSGVDTWTELQKLSTTTDKFLKYADNVSGAVAPDSTDFSLMGITGVVSTYNLTNILSKIDTANAAGIDTFDEIQSLVSHQRIIDFATDATVSNTAGAPTFADWSSLRMAEGSDLTDELAANVTVYNKAVEYKVATGVDQLSELQTLVIDYNAYVTDWSTRVETVNMGTATDLFHSHLTGGIAGGTASGTAAENATRIGKLIDLAESTVTAYTSVSSPSGLTAVQLTKADLTALGLNTTLINNGTGTTRSNDTVEMDNIWATIQNITDLRQIDSLEEIQGIINYWTVI